MNSCVFLDEPYWYHRNIVRNPYDAGFSFFSIPVHNPDFTVLSKCGEPLRELWMCTWGFTYNDPKFSGKTSLGKKCRPRSDCRIRHFTVFYSICIIWYHTMVELCSLNFRAFTVKLVGVQKLRNFTVNQKWAASQESRSSGFPTQTGMCSDRRWLEAWKFRFRK